MASTSEQGSATEDVTEEYDRQHGRTTDADEQKSSGLTDAGNKAPQGPQSFRVTTAGK